MLRLLLVFVAIGVGVLYSLRGPFQMLLFYIWYAYFRPDMWVWDGGLVADLNLSFVIGVFLLVFTLMTRLGALRITSGWVLLAVFLAHCTLSTAVSPYDQLGLASLQQFGKAAVITLLIPMIVDDAAKLRLLLATMALSLGFEAAKQGWVQLVTNPGAINTNSVPFLGDNNHVAVGMLMLVPVLGALAATATATWEKQMHRFLAVGVLYRALATYSRGGFLSAVVMAGIGLVRSKHRVRTLLAMVVVSGLILPLMPQHFWDRMETILTPGEIQRDAEVVEDSSARGRLHFWAVAVQMAATAPITGVGHGNYMVAYDDYDSSNGQYGFRRAVHSSWFGTLGELGYVGLVLYLAIILNTLWTARATRLATRGSPEHTALHQFAIMLETSMAVFCVGGTFVTMQYNEMVWHFIGIGMVLQVLRRQVEVPMAVSAASVGATPDRGASLGWQEPAGYRRGEL